MRRTAPLIKASHRIEKALNGCYRMAPLTYSIYQPGSPGRVEFQAENPSAVWRGPETDGSLVS